MSPLVTPLVSPQTSPMLNPEASSSIQNSPLPKCMSRENSYEVFQIFTNRDEKPTYVRFQKLTFEFLMKIFDLRSKIFNLLKEYKDLMIRFHFESENVSKLNLIDVQNLNYAKMYAIYAIEAIELCSNVLEQISIFNAVTDRFMSTYSENPKLALDIIMQWFHENIRQSSDHYFYCSIENSLSFADGCLTQAEKILNFQDQNNYYKIIDDKKYLSYEGIIAATKQLVQANNALLLYKDNPKDNPI